MEIIKIDNDTFQIKTETIEEVSLSQLEQELAELKRLNKEIEDLEKEINELPEHIRRYIKLPYYHDSEIEELEKKLKLING
jgi:ribosomal 50S subunit-associated protein YjgA (DUF615 family)